MPVMMSWMSGLPFWRGLCGAWVALAAVAKVAVLLGLGRIGDPDTSGRRSPRPKKDSSELLPLVLLLLERVFPALIPWCVRSGCSSGLSNVPVGLIL